VQCKPLWKNASWTTHCVDDTLCGRHTAWTTHNGGDDCKGARRTRWPRPIPSPHSCTVVGVSSDSSLRSGFPSSKNRSGGSQSQVRMTFLFTEHAVR